MADERVGFLEPRIVEVMSFLNGVCPAYYFPADNDRKAMLYPNGGAWLRGGTSPSGDDQGDVGQANWFIGERYVDGASLGMPQRVVWIPPQEGEERFVEPDSAGHHKVGDAFGRTYVGGLQGDESQLPKNLAYRKVLSRVCPVKVDIWGNDWDDTDQLVHWLASCILATNAGAPEYLREKTIQSGGYVRMEKGQRGVRYRMAAIFVFPVIAPFLAGGVGSADAFRAIGMGVAVKPVSSDTLVQDENQPQLSDDRLNNAVQNVPARGALVPDPLDVSPWTGPNAPIWPAKIYPK